MDVHNFGLRLASKGFFFPFFFLQVFESLVRRFFTKSQDTDVYDWQLKRQTLIQQHKGSIPR